MATCINCEREVTDNFCAHCSQRTGVKRITLREAWNDFWARVYGFDGMFPRTLRDLTLRPGLAAREFIAGNRVKYYGPVGYFFLMVTLFLLALGLLNMDFSYFATHAGAGGFQKMPKPGSGQEKVLQQTYQLVSDNLKIISFIIIPFQAVASRYIFFRKQNLNFLEHMVLPFYLQGHFYWINVIIALNLKIFHSLVVSYPMIVLGFIYIPFGFMNFFSHQSKIIAFLKGIGVYLTAQLLYGILVVTIVVIVIALNPDLYEMIKPSNN